MLHRSDALLDRPHPHADPARCALALQACGSEGHAQHPFGQRVRRAVVTHEAACWTLAELARVLDTNTDRGA